MGSAAAGPFGSSSRDPEAICEEWLEYPQPERSECADDADLPVSGIAISGTIGRNYVSGASSQTRSKRIRC